VSVNRAALAEGIAVTASINPDDGITGETLLASLRAILLGFDAFGAARTEHLGGSKCSFEFLTMVHTFQKKGGTVAFIDPSPTKETP
jgi:hypothetical protein